MNSSVDLSLPSSTSSFGSPVETKTNSTLSSLGICNNGGDVQSSCASSLRRSVSNEVQLIESSHDRQHRSLLQNRTRDMTINKLNSRDLGLVGREHEQAILEKSLARVTRHNSRELALIRGNSGTGKSVLGSSIRKTVEATNKRALFVMGKFDYSRKEPYSAIASFGREICGALLLRNKEDEEDNIANIVENLAQQLGSELLYLLLGVVPEVEDLFGSGIQHTSDIKNQSSVTNATQSQQQFNHAFRLFIRVLCHHCKPLVILLDDLQWADASSLDVLEVMLTDNDNKGGLLVTGCYRLSTNHEENSMTTESDNLELNKRLNDWKEKANNNNRPAQQGFVIREIHIGNLSLDQTLQVVMTLLSIQDENQVDRTLPLATICHKRTQGNPFFLLSFLHSLQQQSFLSFNLGTLQWNWNMERIEEETASTENIVEVAMKKIVRVHPELGKVLQIASLLGSRFNDQVLLLVWTKLFHVKKGPTNKNTQQKELANRLTQAVEQSYIEQVGNNQFQWVHDKVQEAAMALVPDEDQAAFRFDVGMCLFQNLNKRDLHTQLFVVVDLLDSKECLEMIVNLQIANLSAIAAKKARKLSAFSSAARYANIGISHLSLADANSDKGKWFWDNSYDLALELHCISVECEFVVGNDTTNLKRYSDAVLEKGRTVLDKIPVYYVLALSMGKLGQFSEATDLLSKAVNELGVVYIPNSGTLMAAKTMLGLLSTKKLLTSRKADEFPFMTDPKQMATQKLLDLLASYSYQADKTFLLLYATIKMVKLSTKSGICSWAPSAVAQYGALVSGVLNDLPAGVHICEMALGMVRRLEGQANEALVIARAWGFTLGYSRLPHDALKQFLHGYTEGMRFGDTEMASWCLFNHVATSFSCGKSLRTIGEDCRIYSPYIRDLGWVVVEEALTHYFEAVCYLTSEDEDSYRCLFFEKKGKSNFQDLAILVCRSAAYAYSADYEAGADYALKVGEALRKGAPGHSILISEIFTRGVCLYAMARNTGKVKYKRPARAIRKTIKNLVQQGSLNQNHQLYLLNAEDEALSKNRRKASISYREGIIAATRGSFLRDAALINERYADFLLNDMSDLEQASRHAEDAIRHFEEWGAVRTVEHLKLKYSSVLKNNIPVDLVIGNARSHSLTMQEEVSELFGTESGHLLNPGRGMAMKQSRINKI